MVETERRNRQPAMIPPDLLGTPGIYAARIAERRLRILRRVLRVFILFTAIAVLAETFVTGMAYRAAHPITLLERKPSMQYVPQHRNKALWVGWCGTVQIVQRAIHGQLRTCTVCKVHGGGRLIYASEAC